MTRSRAARLLIRLAPLALPGLGALAFAPGLGGGYLFDDVPNLLDNPGWKVVHGTFAEWMRAWHSGFASDFGRPLAMLSFAINHWLTGTDPFWLKATNLAIHLGNGVLAWRLVRRLFALAPEGPARPGATAAWLVALAWTVHPLQVSSVLYLVQRMEVAAHTFVLLALLAYLEARRPRDEARGASRLHAPLWLAVAALCTLVGLGFKESALLVPLYALLIEIALLRFRDREGHRSRSLMALHATGAIAGIALFAVWAWPRVATSAAWAIRDFTMGERLLSQGPVLAMYLGQILLPTPGRLRFYYDGFPISHGLLDPPTTLAAFVLLGALVLLALACLRRAPLIALGIGWFFAAHFLTSNVWPLELAFEHRNYFALLGILIVAACAMQFATRRLHADARLVLGTLPVAYFGVLCAIQAATWNHPLSLAMSLASRGIESPRAAYDYGRMLLGISGFDDASPMFSQARAEFEHASRLPRASALADQALIFMDARTGRAIAPAQWQRLRERLVQHAAGPQERAALAALADCRATSACRLDDRELVETFLAVLARNPGSADLHAIYAAYALNALHDADLAIRMGEEAVRLAPDAMAYRLGLAKILAATGAPAEETARQIEAVCAANRWGEHDAELAEVAVLLHRNGCDAACLCGHADPRDATP